MPHGKIYQNVTETVGNTPLIQLNRLTAGLGARIAVKHEGYNPFNSVKDRIGMAMVQDAIERGALKPGMVIVEPTSGNTGVGLAQAAAVKGYRCIFVIADKQSEEKRALLRAYGAEIVICPTDVDPDDERSYYRVSDRLARETPGACFLPFHFREAAANLLTLDELDPIGKIPEFKFCAVKIEREAKENTKDAKDTKKAKKPGKAAKSRR